jgi:hypothetical protein
VAGPDAAGCPGEPITFDAGQSFDPDGDVLSYRWDLGDGEIETWELVKHRYAASGRFLVQLTIDDGSEMACGTASAGLMAEINAPPVAAMHIEGESGPVAPGGLPRSSVGMPDASSQNESEPAVPWR